MEREVLLCSTREAVDVQTEKLALMMTALCCVWICDRAMHHIKRLGILDTQLQYTEQQAVSENSSKNVLTATSSLTTLPHKLLLLSHPKCGGKLKIIQRRKGGLAD